MTDRATVTAPLGQTTTACHTTGAHRSDRTCDHQGPPPAEPAEEPPDLPGRTPVRQIDQRAHSRQLVQVNAERPSDVKAANTMETGRRAPAMKVGAGYGRLRRHSAILRECISGVSICGRASMQECAISALLPPETLQTVVERNSDARKTSPKAASDAADPIATSVPITCEVRALPIH